MATTSTTPRDKFLELRKSGVDAQTARKQAYGDIIPPVGTSTPPVQNPPTVPPQQTTPPQTVAPTRGSFNEQTQGMNVVERQMYRSGGIDAIGAKYMRDIRTNNPLEQKTVTGVNGEQFQVAPVNPQTGLSQPAQTQSPVTPTPTPAPSFAEQSQGMSVSERQALRSQTPTPSVPDATPDKTAEIKAQTESQMSLNKQQADIKEQERQRIAQETKIANTPVNQKDVLNAFISGVSVPEQNTQAYRNAKVQYDTFKKFNAMTPTQLLDNLKQGQIGTEMDSLLSQNPGYIEAKQKLAQVQRTASLNRMGQSALGVINGKEPEDLSDLSKVEAKYNAPPGTNVEAYQSYVVNNEDVKTAGTALKNIATQISDVTKTYNDALKSLKAQYGDMPASALLTLMSTRTQDTKSLLDSLIDAKTLAQGDFDMAMKMAEGSYGAYTKDLAVQQGIEAEQRQMENSIALSQMEFDQKLEQNAMLASDPTTAIGNILNQFSELGIIPDRDVAWHVAEQKRLGMTLPEYTKKIIADFKAKPEYKAMAEAQMRSFAPEAESSKYSFANLGDGTIAIQDQTTGNVIFKSAKGAILGTDANGNPVQVTSTSKTGNSLLDTQDGTVIPSRLSSTTNTNNGKECGEYVNDIAGASIFGNTIEQKKSAASETTGGIGKAIVWQPSQSEQFKKYGHVGVIIGEEGGNWIVKSSNLRGDGAVSTDLVPKSASSNYKTLKNVSIKPVSTQSTSIRPSDIDYFNSATPTDKKKLQSNPQFIDFSNKKSAVMGDPNADIYEVMQYSQGGKDMGEERLKSLGKFSQGLSQVAELSKKIQETETGPIIGRIRSYNPYDANAQALLAEINSVVPNIARGVYGEVGVLTDADIQNYAKTLPNIKSTEDTNKLVLAMTLKTMLNGFKGQIQIDGSAGRDVSGFVGTVKQYEDRINNLLQQLGSSAQSSQPQNTDSDFDNLYNQL